MYVQYHEKSYGINRKKGTAMETGKSTFWKDFKNFISKGNVLDMAIGVIIGASFGKIVTGLVNFIINPFVGLFVSGQDLDTIKTVITPAVLNEAGEVVTKEVAILWGSWFQTILDFLITALCLFVILRLFIKAKNQLEADKIEEQKKKDKAAADKAAEEKKLAEQTAVEETQKQERFRTSIIQQEKLLTEIRDLLKNR